MSRSVFAGNLIAKLVPKEFKRIKFFERPNVAEWLEKKLFEDDKLYVLPKDNIIPVGETLDDPDNIVMPSQVAKHFVEEAGFLWLMDQCICRYGVGCKDFPIDFGCMFLGEAARGINPKMGHEVSKEEGLEHLERCREAGLVHFLGRSKLDTVYHKIGPGDRLFTICSCCPCCCITRGMPYSTKNISRHLLKMPGVSVVVSDDCTACGECEDSCFMKAITVNEERAEMSEECRACGRCVDVCPQGAISVRLDNEFYVQEAIESLAKSINVK